MLQILASQQNKKQADELGRIERALRRLAETPGEFGLCEECDEELPFKRLELMPYATLCTECQAARDPRRGASRKSLTDYKG
jgi:DnaK suppressor protein